LDNAVVSLATDERGLSPLVPEAGRTIRNWNGSDLSHPRVVAVPRDVDDLVAILKDRDTYPAPLRAGGSFHSMNACFETTGTQILTKAFDSLKVDLGAGTVTVGAGVTLLQIRNALRPLGVQLEVTPEIGNATAGSVCC